jgi:hypothetical protein
MCCDLRFSRQSLVLKNLPSTRSEAHLGITPSIDFHRLRETVGNKITFFSDIWRLSSGAGAISDLSGGKISFPSIHPVFRSSFIENHRHSIVNAYDQPIRPGSDDGEGSLPWPVAAATTRKVGATRAISLGNKSSTKS